MSEVEFKKFAICDTCGVETLCREDGEDDQCGGCYWAPINHAKHPAELAALREELAQRESFENLYNAAIDERDALMEELNQAKSDRDCEQRACIEAHQRLADADRRNADTTAKLELAASMMDDDERGNRFAEVCRLAIESLKPTESGASE